MPDLFLSPSDLEPLWRFGPLAAGFALWLVMPRIPHVQLF